MTRRHLTCGVFLWAVVVAAHLEAAPINFGRDIRPLLSDRCFKCHGPDRGVADNDLRLDVRDEAIKSAIVPGSPEKSELIERITTHDESLKMPPVDSERKPLSEEEVELVRTWIREGAEYKEHWAYSPPELPPVPDVRKSDWPACQIDRFVLATLEENGLQPAPEADRRTLIRRLSFDLLGLPPRPEDVQAFVTDDSPDAYERLVDRLLMNEHFGERMAMYWLDLVRYADTGGYHSDNERSVDAFRDYVIQSFNDNKPFDQFTLEQLAGDLLPEPTLEQKIASGYNRLLQTTGEGGAQAKEYVAIYQADRVRNVSTVWLAATMGCCQCHDHKFDPFTMRDFYSLGAFFADINEVAVGVQPPNLSLPTPEQSARIAELERQLDDVRNNANYDDEMKAWVAENQADAQRSRNEIQPVAPLEATSRGGANITVLPDKSALVLGEDPDREVYTVRIPASAPKITAIRLEAMTHSSFTKQSLSRANGNFVLTGVEISLKQQDQVQPLKISRAEADYEQVGFPIANTLDDDPSTGWAVDGYQRVRDCRAVFVFETPLEGGDGVEIVIALRQESEFPRHNIGRFRFSLMSSEEPTVRGAAGFPPDLLTILQKDPEKLNDRDRKVLEKGFREHSPAAAEVRQQLEELEKKLTMEQAAIRTTLVAEARMEPREVRVLARGNWMDDSGAIVEPAIPARFGALPVSDRRATRLDLARWLVDPNNPLTARVFVNRVWKVLFGWGIARSLEDFGYQGEWPSQPQLLDWLAIDFVEHGWDVKRLIKQIVMSQTYRQSSQGSAEAHRRDPFNKLLARQGRFRLNAEMVRDNALAVSGLLVNDVGGPSVKPYQPAGYWQHLNFPPREWEADHGANQYRRGLYTFWCRSFLHPSLLAFDATSREECTAERPRSNTPLQALVLLNDPTYVEAARVLAARTAKQSGSDQDRLHWVWQEVLQRDPTPAEADVVLSLLESERKRYAAAADEAGNITKTGDAPATEEVSPLQLAAWTAVCRTLLNLHETITRY